MYYDFLIICVNISNVYHQKCKKDWNSDKLYSEQFSSKKKKMNDTFKMIHTVLLSILPTRQNFFGLDVNKDRDFCLYFCTADDGKNFLQISFWLYTFSNLIFLQYLTLLVPGAVGNV